MFKACDQESPTIAELLDIIPIEYSGPIYFMGVRLEDPIDLLRERVIQTQKTRSNRPDPSIWSARININPRPALKTTHRDRHSPKALEYHRYKDQILLQAKQWGFLNSWIINAIDCTFLMPLPANCWTARGITPKGFEVMGQPHEIMPDWDNLVKPVQDALSPQDSAVYLGVGRKLWSPIRNGAILIRLKYRSKP